MFSQPREGGKFMYSPKISEELIPDLYRWGKKKGEPMTVLVNRIISKEIKKQNRKGGDLYAGQIQANLGEYSGRV